MRIDYPIVIDNDYAIWRAFDNHYWPALYFVDPRGRVRHHHFGEGEYEQSEKVIQRLLAEAGAAGEATVSCRVDCRWRGSAGRLGQLAISGELSRARADGELRIAGRGASGTGVASMPPLPAWR